MKKMNWVSIGILIFIVTFIAWLSVFVYFGESYIISLPIAIVFFTISVIFLVRWKRISIPMFQNRLPIYVVIFLITGLLFLASGIFDYGFSAFSQNMSIQEQLNFYRALRPDKVSFGFTEIGIGILLLLGGFSNLKGKVSPEANTQNQKYKKTYVFTLCVGIISFVYGIYLLISGLYP